MARLACPIFAWLCMWVARGAAGDEFDRRCRFAVAYVERKSDDVSFLAGLPELSAEQRTDLMKRIALLPVQARALFYWELAGLGHAEASTELDTLLRQLALTGRVRIPYTQTLIDLAETGRRMSKPEMQCLAAGLLLAGENIPEGSDSLYHAVHTLGAREADSKVSLNDRRKAVTTIGWLHLRKVWSEASQKELAQALRHRTDWEIRMRAASFVGATGDPASVGQLLEALRVEKDARALERIVAALATDAAYPPELRWPLVAEMVRMGDDFDIPAANRRMADLVARSITGVEGADAQLAWWKEKEKELVARAAAKKGNSLKAGGPDLPVSPPPDTSGGPQAPPVSGGPAASDPPTPPKDPASAPNAAERDCARWLLLAKNHVNQREYDKAESWLKRVLSTCPEGKQADEARELLKKVASLKNL